MRMSKLFSQTLRAAPSEAEVVSHQLLLRAGFIRQLGAGIFSYLPLAKRSLNKIENIMREEINAIGGQEVFMPTLNPKENWETTGRWKLLDEDVYKTNDGEKREYLLAPTHEEVIVPLIKKFVGSYKDLPMAAYHIQNKFRKEKRAKDRKSVV